jgi:hypothetical protein
MSEDAKPAMKTNQTLLDKVIPQQLEKFIAAALAKLRNAWPQKNTLTGIQFYWDMDD